MHIDIVLERLQRLPPELPSPPSALEADMLGRGRGPGSLARTAAPSRDAAALVLLYPGAADEAFVLLTLRPRSEHIHGGQVALPGGKREPGDAFPEGTALREAHEEVGLDADAAGVRTMGLLESVDIRVSGFLLVPVLAVAARAPRLVADPREVAELLPVPVRHFLPGAPIRQVEEERGGRRLRYGAFPVAGQHVWGATARVLGQLGVLLDPPSDPARGAPG